VSSNRDDLEMMIEADQVGGVARLQAGIVRVRERWWQRHREP